MKKMFFFFAVIGTIVVSSAKAQCDSSLLINVSQWLICHDDSIKITSPTGWIWDNSHFTSYNWVYSVKGEKSVLIPDNSNVIWIKKPKTGTISVTVKKSTGGYMYGEAPIVNVAATVQLWTDVLVKNHDTVTFENGRGTIYSQTQKSVNCLSTYSWYDVDTKDVESLSPNALNFKSGNYVLRVMNNDNRPCVTFSDTVTIMYSTSKPTGVVKLELENLQVYPNPVVDLLILDNIKNGTMVRVIDISGKEVYQNISEDNKLQIDSSNWVPGIYTIFIGDSIKKIIKY